MIYRIPCELAPRKDMARPRKGEEKRADTIVSLRMPSALKEAVQEVAAREHRSFTSQVIVALEEHLARVGKPKRIGK